MIGVCIYVGAHMAWHIHVEMSQVSPFTFPWILRPPTGARTLFLDSPQEQGQKDSFFFSFGHLEYEPKRKEM